MLQLYADWVPVLLVAVVVVGLASVMLILNYVLGPKRPNKIKAIPYEGGFDPIANARHRFPVKFYMTAILFLVFDLEVVFIYPWAAKYKDFLEDPAFAGIAFGGMMFFVAVLALGLLYEWKRGSLKWE